MAKPTSSLLGAARFWKKTTEEQEKEALNNSSFADSSLHSNESRIMDSPATATSIWGNTSTFPSEDTMRLKKGGLASPVKRVASTTPTSRLSPIKPSSAKKPTTPPFSRLVAVNPPASVAAKKTSKTTSPVKLPINTPKATSSASTAQTKETDSSEELPDRTVPAKRKQPAAITETAGRPSTTSKSASPPHNKSVKRVDETVEPALTSTAPTKKRKERELSELLGPRNNQTAHTNVSTSAWDSTSVMSDNTLGSDEEEEDLFGSTTSSSLQHSTTTDTPLPRSMRHSKAGTPWTPASAAVASAVAASAASVSSDAQSDAAPFSDTASVMSDNTVASEEEEDLFDSTSARAPSLRSTTTAPGTTTKKTAQPKSSAAANRPSQRYTAAKKNSTSSAMSVSDSMSHQDGSSVMSDNTLASEEEEDLFGSTATSTPSQRSMMTDTPLKRPTKTTERAAQRSTMKRNDISGATPRKDLSTSTSIGMTVGSSVMSDNTVATDEEEDLFGSMVSSPLPGQQRSTTKRTDRSGATAFSSTSDAPHMDTSTSTSFIKVMGSSVMSDNTVPTDEEEDLFGSTSTAIGATPGRRAAQAFGSTLVDEDAKGVVDPMRRQSQNGETTTTFSVGSPASNRRSDAFRYDDGGWYVGGGAEAGPDSDDERDLHTGMSVATPEPSVKASPKPTSSEKKRLGLVGEVRSLQRSTLGPYWSSPSGGPDGVGGGGDDDGDRDRGAGGAVGGGQAGGAAKDGEFAMPGAPSTKRPRRAARSRASRPAAPEYVFEEIKTPIVDGKALRKRLPRLDHHRNERIVYGTSPSSSMPSILGVIRNVTKEDYGEDDDNDDEGTLDRNNPLNVPALTSLPALTMVPVMKKSAIEGGEDEEDEEGKEELKEVARTIAIWKPEFSAIGGKGGKTRRREGSLVLEDPVFDEPEDDEFDENGEPKDREDARLPQHRWRPAAHTPRAEIAEAFGCVSGWLKISRGSEQYFDADPDQSKIFFMIRGLAIFTIGHRSTHLPTHSSFIVPPGNPFTIAHGSDWKTPILLAFVALPGDVYPTSEYK